MASSLQRAGHVDAGHVGISLVRIVGPRFHCIPSRWSIRNLPRPNSISSCANVPSTPNGQIPAYEWNFSDVNPPVIAWAAWRVYQIERKQTGKGDRAFLENHLPQNADRLHLVG